MKMETNKKDRLQQPQARASESGVTLIETLIAITVLSITLLGLVQALPLSIRMNTNARKGISVLSIAQANVERLKTEASLDLTHFNALANGSAKYTLEGDITTNASLTTYTVQWTITSGGLTDADGNVLSKIITVRAVSSKGEYGPGSDITLIAEVVRPTSPGGPGGGGGDEDSDHEDSEHGDD